MSNIIFPLLCCGFLLLVLVVLSITTIPAGHVGIVDTFGSVSERPLGPGMSFVNPFAKVVPMSLQTQIITVSENVPTKEGLDVHLEAAALVRLQPKKAVEMYTAIGQKYIDTAVVPQFRSVIRAITSGHDAKDLYAASTRESMGLSLHNELSTLLNARGLKVMECLLKKLELPARLHAAIEDKLQAEQASQKMQFVLQKQKQEAERLVIEAKGIAQYQKIVSADITETLLRWKGIEATEKLANSANAKVVVIGSGSQGGLPLILNPKDTT